MHEKRFILFNTCLGSYSLWFEPTEYEAQSADLEKELQDALTSRKDLESNNEGTQPYFSKGI